MKVLVTGSGGQLGQDLRKDIPAGWTVRFLSSRDLDIRDGTAVSNLVGVYRPDLIINAAAYTAVDRAEEERDLAFAVNDTGVGLLVDAADEVGARVIHVSTDFIFDGHQSSPYLPEDEPHPLSVYGASKLAGEQKILAAAGRHVIIRTSWLYSSRSNNFVRTMLRLMGEREEIGVVADQIGTPTWADGLAAAVWEIGARPEIGGIQHWTDAGVASWYDFAVAIQEESRAAGMLGTAAKIIPLRTEDYPTPARRPSYSVLDKTATWKELGLLAPHWRVNLRQMLKELRAKSDG
jgi:dTDP-4-dehydrorhamnose reductase